MTVFVVPETELEQKVLAEENRWEFRTSEDSKLFSLPKLGFLPRKPTKFLKSQMGQIPEHELMRGLVEILCPEAFPVVDEMEDDQVMELQTAWIEASGIDVGESTASDVS